ncbi:MAG TPA: alpha/beta fold hydrolase [Nevskiales bacterium]|nr:alpha/beta fold hydrolase [Nevskiales bacterium]
MKLSIRMLCIVGGAALLLAQGAAGAVCRDNVVLVHGNARYPSDFNNTYNELLSRGYSSSQVYRPSWGSKSCPACNDHSGSEETPVRDAISNAIAASCTGKIDVIGHSMGATLAAKQIIDLGKAAQVDTFIGIASAYRGLWSCGTYPYQYPTTTCGYWGLSVNSPFLNWLYGKTLGTDVYSFLSWQDEVICSTGVCTVGGVHSSAIAGADAHYVFALGHFGLLYYTDDTQVDLIQ